MSRVCTAGRSSLTCEPPHIPEYLKNVYDLKPIVGIPSDEEVKGIHAVIRAASTVSPVPGMFDADLSMNLAQHLFDVQMARYRDRYPCILPLDIVYVPPALPSHVPIILEPVVGAPSDEEMKKAHAAARLYDYFASIPSMFDPDVSMEISQHVFNIQLARYIQHTAQGQPRAESTYPVGTSYPVDRSRADARAGLVPPQVDYQRQILKPQPERILPTAINVDTKLKLAVRTIEMHYSRYRLRCNALGTGPGDPIWALHNDYKRDAESIAYPSRDNKGFRQHARILLGYMPHALVYTRGLDKINQQQKDANKKRLQKVQHEELENLQLRMMTCSTLSKRLKSLVRNIMPGSSTLHQINNLRAQIKQADELRSAVIQAFGEDVISADLEQHYLLGISVILSTSHKNRVP